MNKILLPNIKIKVELKPLNPSKQIQVSGSNLPNTFSLVNVHFHWGSKKGSEHTVDGKSYALEMHIVNKNVEEKLAVLGFFVEESQVVKQNLKTFWNNAMSLDLEKGGLFYK